jgi:hypothetical protein
VKLTNNVHPVLRIMRSAITLQPPRAITAQTGYGFLNDQCKGREGIRNEVMAPVALNLSTRRQQSAALAGHNSACQTAPTPIQRRYASLNDGDTI